jgi:hypothetical protein
MIIFVIIFLIIITLILLIINCFKEYSFKVDNFNNSKVESISFAYPTNKFKKYDLIRNNSLKNNFFSHIIPGKSIYNFNEEINYISHYSNCYFALTYKKSGWDCLRHYEIIAAGSIPYFLDIDNIPETIMTTFPKNLVKKAMKIRGVPSENYISNYIKKNNKLYLSIPTNFDYKNYYKLRYEILNHFENQCLTNKLIKNNLTYKQTYLISAFTNSKQDYMRDLFIISLLENNHNVYTNFDINYIFDDYNKDTNSMYGRGMTYTKCLNKNLKKNYKILNNFKNFKDYSNIIFTTKSNRPRLNIDNYVLPPSSFLYELDGNDINFVDKSMHKKTIKKFIRELN